MVTLFCIRPKGFNVGNDAIFMGMQHFLQEAFGQVVNIITLPATSRYESQAKAGLTARTIHEINLYGHGVIVGGGNLYENGELEVNLDSLRTLQVPLFLFSLSRGRIYNRRHELIDRTDVMPDRILQAINQKASLSLARDEVTHSYLNGLGLDQVQLGGCPTIFLDKQLWRLPRLPEVDQTGVLISIRTPDLMNIPLSKQAQVRGDVERIIAFLRAEGHSKIRLLCHDHRDVAFAASFTDIEYVYTSDVYTYLALLRSCSLNISYRLHATLPSLAFGTPTIKITYDERALSLMETVGYGGWNINMMASGDLLADVQDRYRRLDELPQLKHANQGIWSGHYETMLNSFRQFADEVNAYRDRPSAF